MKKLIITTLLAVLTGTAAVAQTNRLTATPATIEAGGRADVTVNLINESPMTAFQMDITLPEGFTFHYTTSRGKKTYTVKLTERADDHSLSMGVDESNTVMSVAALSGTSADFYDTNMDDDKLNGLLTFGIVADSDVEPGLYQGTVTNIKFTENVHDGDNLIGKTHKLDDAVFTIMVLGDGTTVTLNVSDAGMATLMLPFGASVPEGLQAWHCTDVADDVVVAAQLGSIPANTPLLVTGTPGTYTFTGTPVHDAMQYTSGVLTGTYELLNVTSGHVLQNHDGCVAFYCIDAVDGENILPYRCYMPAAKGVAGVRMYRILWEDMPTGINAADANAETKAYDLGGRRTDATQGRGIKIINNIKTLKR